MGNEGSFLLFSFRDFHGCGFRYRLRFGGFDQVLESIEHDVGLDTDSDEFNGVALCGDGESVTCVHRCARDRVVGKIKCHIISFP